MKKLLTISALLLLSGCAHPTLESPQSDYSLQMDNLARSTASEILSSYSGKLVYVDASHAPGSFADRLRQELASRRMLSIRKDISDITLKYALEELTPTMGYINLRFSDGRSISRTFPLAPANTYSKTAMPATPMPLES